MSILLHRYMSILFHPKIWIHLHRNISILSCIGGELNRFASAPPPSPRLTNIKNGFPSVGCLRFCRLDVRQLPPASHSAKFCWTPGPVFIHHHARSLASSAYPSQVIKWKRRVCFMNTYVLLIFLYSHLIILQGMLEWLFLVIVLVIGSF